jgi:hypothetical protein
MMTVDPYETNVLRPEVHGRLVSDISHVAQDAHIEPHWIWTKLSENVTTGEYNWVKNFAKHKGAGNYGLCIVGNKAKIDPTTRMSAMAGALLRNFIRARVCSVGEVIDYREHGADDRITALFVPNFFLGKAQGSSLPAWKLTHLIDVLVERRLAGLQTVVYVSDLNALSEEYGVGFTQHFKSYFTIVNA